MSGIDLRQDGTAPTLAERLRAHVVARGGPARDGDGRPVCANGAWTMMLQAADEIERLGKALDANRDAGGDHAAETATGARIAPANAPYELTDAAVDAGLAATAGWLSIPGSALSVAREKMRLRWRAILDHLAKREAGAGATAPASNYAVVDVALGRERVQDGLRRSGGFAVEIDATVFAIDEADADHTDFLASVEAIRGERGLAMTSPGMMIAIGAGRGAIAERIEDGDDGYRVKVAAVLRRAATTEDGWSSYEADVTRIVAVGDAS